MRTHFTSDINEIGLTEESWNSIVSKSETNTIFQTYQWFQSWWKVFGDQNELFFVWVSDSDKVLGFAPLMISTDKKGYRTLQFVGEGNADYCDFIIERDKVSVLNRMMDAIYTESKKWDMIFLNNIPESSKTFKVLNTKNGVYRNRIMATSHVSCPTLITNESADADRISKKKSLRRRINYFKKRGELSFRIIKDISNAEKCLDNFFDQHIKRWDAKRNPSLFLNPQNRTFYRKLMEATIERGWLMFSVVELDGNPVAFHYGFDYNSKIIWYKPSFDIKFKKYSPGLVLIKYLIDYAIENKKTELDFTLGDEPFKKRFTNYKRNNVELRIYKSKKELFINLAQYYLKRMMKKIAGWRK